MEDSITRHILWILTGLELFRQPQFSSSHISLLPFLSQSKNLVHGLLCSCTHEQKQLSTPSLTSIVVSIIIWVDISHLLSFLGRRHATCYSGLGMIRIEEFGGLNSLRWPSRRDQPLFDDFDDDGGHRYSQYILWQVWSCFGSVSTSAPAASPSCLSSHSQWARLPEVVRNWGEELSS